MTFLDQRGSEIVRRVPATEATGAEIGVWDGRLSKWLLRHHENLHLIMVDRWESVPPDHRYAQSESQMAQSDQTKFENVYAQARLVHIKFPKRTSIIKSESIVAARLIGDRTLDFAFIDADHTYQGVSEDIAAWSPKVKPGGWLCGHDWEHPDHLGEWGVREAVEEFTSERGYEIELGQNRTWFVRLASPR